MQPQLHQAPGQRRHHARLLRRGLERLLVVGCGAPELAARARGIAQQRIDRGELRGVAQQHAQLRIGAGEVALRDHHLGQRQPGRVVVRPQLDRVLQCLAREGVHALGGVGAADAGLRDRIGRVLLGGAGVVAQRLVVRAALQQQGAVAGQHVAALVARGQCALEVLLGARAVALQQGDLAQRAVGAGEVRVEAQRGLEIGARGLELARVQFHAGQGEVVVGPVGRQLDRAPQQLLRLAQVALLAAQDARAGAGSRDRPG